MRKKILLVTLLISTIIAFAQDNPQTAIGKLGPDPIFLIDSQKVRQSDLLKYSPDSIATVIILYDTSAIKNYGDSAKDGAVIIETRSFARSNFIAFFRKSSQPYDSLYKVVGNDNSFTYILNDKVQKGNYEGNLSAISEELFGGLEILTKEQLYLKYNIRDKQFGILVHSKTPIDVYNGEKKF